jgi:FMN phosphatase YigB (HAD superfamily)
MLVDSIFFDYGGVVADHYCEPYQGRLAEAFGTSRKMARELVSEKSVHGRLYRLNQLSKTAFWEEVRRLAPQKSFRDDVVQELWARTYIPNVAVLELLRFLREEVGAQTGIVMNEDVSRLSFIINNYRLDAVVSSLVASCEVGVVKPDSGIYAEILKRGRREVCPQRVLYVDDRQSHVDAAMAAGMEGYQYTNAGDLSIFISDLIEKGEVVRFNPGGDR